MARWVAGMVVAGALLLSACGGDDEETQPAQTQAPPAETQPAETQPGESQQAANGQQIFSENCARCHTLAAADATGQVGPNLDDLQPDKETVVRQVINGGDGMPAFGDQLSEEEIDAVATFVAENAGS